MKDSVLTQKVMTRKRTPYYDAVARLWSYHEAGHVVVGHALGWRVLWASLKQVRYQTVVVEDPLFARTGKEKSRRIAARRRAMVIVAAGHVAATIHQGEVDRLGYSSPQESRAYSTWWQIRASMQVRGNFSHIHNPASDSYCLARDAATICTAQAVERGLPTEAAEDPKAIIEALFHDHAERRDAEILRAEERAERILQRQWASVSDIAAALHRSKSGVLSRKRLLAILGRHFQPQAQVA